MSKAVLISIKPKWCELIASGKKTVEVRKSRPNLSTPFKCYIYCTKAQNPVLVALQNLEESPLVMTCGTGTRRYPVEDTTWARLLNGTVCGEFTCDRFYQYTTTAIKDGADISDEDMERLSCLSRAELLRYEHSSPSSENRIQYFGLYGWHITDLKIYAEPKELSEFTKPCPKGHNCATCSWYFPGIQDYGRCEPPCCGFWESDDSMIARLQQSWCYVEELSVGQ